MNDELIKKIREITEQSTRDTEHHMLKKYGERIATTRRTANGAEVEIRDYKFRDDIFRVITVNGECVTIDVLAREERK